jgi:hypothetical protein
VGEEVGTMETTVRGDVRWSKIKISVKYEDVIIYCEIVYSREE